MPGRHLLLIDKRKKIVGISEDPAHSLSEKPADRSLSGPAYAHHNHDHRRSRNLLQDQAR
jgi:hypothetical protein